MRDKRTGRRHTICRGCRRAYCRSYHRKDPDTYNARRRVRLAAYRVRNQAFVLAYLRDHPCADCGLDDPIVMEFDHVRGAKRCPVSDLVREGANLETLTAEIAKCVVRCANCHRRRTARTLWPGNARVEEGLTRAMAY